MFSSKPSRAKLDHSKDNEIYTLFSFNPPKVSEKERAPLDLALVIDRSGSMSGQKMEYVHKSIEKLISLLKPDDTVVLVAFDSVVEHTKEPVKCDTTGKAALVQELHNINARGGTNLSAGLFKGLEFVHGKGKDTVRLRKCMLFTDGQQNEGVIDPNKISTMALELRNGTGISTFGYGHDYNADLLGMLAQNGGCYYIDSPDKILTAFGTELGGLISTYAQNVELLLKPGEDVEIEEVMNDVTVEEKDDGSFVAKLDDLLAEMPYHVAVKLKVKSRNNVFPRDTTVLTGAVKFTNLLTAKLDEAMQSVKVRFVKADEADKEDDKDVMKEVAIFMVVKAQVAAMNLANQGQYAAAQVMMTNCSSAVMDMNKDAAAISTGTAGLVGSSGTYLMGGHGTLLSANRSISRNRGGMKGLMIGEVDMGNYASPQQNATASVFDNNQPAHTAPQNIIVKSSVFISPIPNVATPPAIVTPEKKNPKKSRSKRW